MKRMMSAACVAAVIASLGPAWAVPVAPSLAIAQAPLVLDVQYAQDGYRHYPRYGGAVGANGGYKVNRYGFSNYVGGPAGGYAGYPAGSAGAQIYRQKEEWKCQNVPETC